MVQFGRQLVLLLWLFLMFTFIVQLCHGSRTTNVFKIKPKSQYSTGHFLGFLPRHLPIPASGPSRKHNNLGLQSWRSPWRSLPLRSTINRAGKKKGDHDFGFFDYFLLVHLVFHFQLSYWNWWWKLEYFCIWSCWIDHFWRLWSHDFCLSEGKCKLISPLIMLMMTKEK